MVIIKHATQDDLESVAAALESEVQDIRKKMLYLERDLNEKLSEARAIRAVINKHSPRAAHLKAEKQKFLSNIDTKEMKFRDVIREAMKSIREPIRPRDLAKQLETAGITKTGRSDFTTRVGVEMHKLAKVGELVRVDGKYLPAKH